MKALITTAPREKPTLARCLISCHEAGVEPIVFAEPGSLHCLARDLVSEVELRVPRFESHLNEERLGVWRNFKHSVEYALNTFDDEAFLTLQDDAILAPDVLDRLGAAMWPAADVACLSLFTPPVYAKQAAGRQLFPVNHRGRFRGAVAMCWPRVALERFSASPYWRAFNGIAGARKRNQRPPKPADIKHSDFAIGTLAGRTKRRIFAIHPSLAQHVGDTSTIGGDVADGDRAAAIFAGDLTPKEHEAAIDRTLCDPPPITVKPRQHIVELIVPDSKWWRSPARGALYCRRIGEAGGVNVRIRASRPSGYFADLIVNHAMIGPAAELHEIAKANPRTTIAHVNHSSLAYTFNSVAERHRFTACLRGALEIDNVFFCHHDANRLKPFGERCIQWKMPAPTIEPREFRPIGPRIVFGMGGRPNLVKNHYNTLAALREWRDDCRILFFGDVCDSVRELADVLGFKFQSFGRLDHADYLDKLKKRVDVMLQPSLTESFNFMALDASMSGVPCVGAFGVPAAEPSLRADPNEPESIAGAVRTILRNYRGACELAAEWGTRTAEEKNRAYLRTLDILIHHRRQ